LRSTPILLIAALALAVGGVGQVVWAQTRPTTEPADDPRPALVRFFDAVCRADRAAALACWDNDVERDEQRRYVEDLVGHLVDEMIASYRFEQALAQKFPDAYDKARQAGGNTPTTADLAAAQFTVYRRLAIVKWGRNEDDGFPMEFNNADRAHPHWKISMRQWHETNRSSVGDSMLLSGWGAKAKEATAKEILGGDLKTIESVQEAYMRHVSELADAEKRGIKGPSTAPVKR
jgi:hypothetical protein